MRLVWKSGKTMTAVARELGVSLESLRTWVRRQKIEEGKQEGLKAAEREELERLQGGVSRRAREDAEFARRILAIHRESRGVYGAPRIWAEPRILYGVCRSRKRVARASWMPFPAAWWAGPWGNGPRPTWWWTP